MNRLDALLFIVSHTHCSSSYRILTQCNNMHAVSWGSIPLLSSLVVFSFVPHDLSFISFSSDYLPLMDPADTRSSQASFLDKMGGGSDGSAGGAAGAKRAQYRPRASEHSVLCCCAVVAACDCHKARKARNSLSIECRPE